VRGKADEGQVVVEIDPETERHLDQFGEMPLPPYITHRLQDAERYQTVYARNEGSAAAPTAGLHFTDDMLARLQAKDVRIAFVTLHVGLDTFRPVMEEDARAHRIHSEWCAIDADAVAAIEATRTRGGRVIAVGTTAARTLETYGQRVAHGDSGPFRTDTSIYITPGYVWTMVDGLITNFHLPKSTLMLMVSSLAGRALILAAYREAVEHRYRFFSFGDAMIIL
jgi:S-adenosylmethionine:tRNA ribosyltransferase-isomerase